MVVMVEETVTGQGAPTSINQILYLLGEGMKGSENVNSVYWIDVLSRSVI